MVSAMDLLMEATLDDLKSLLLTKPQENNLQNLGPKPIGQYGNAEDGVSILPNGL